MATETLPITIGNTGSATLNYTASTLQSWLSLDVTSGTITSGGTTQTINVTANTLNLTPGNYSGQVNIVSNGGNANVPCTLVVTAQGSGTGGGGTSGPSATASQSTLAFGSVYQS